MDTKSPGMGSRVGIEAPGKPRGGCRQFLGFWDAMDAGGLREVEQLGLSSCCSTEEPPGISGIFCYSRQMLENSSF